MKRLFLTGSLAVLLAGCGAGTGSDPLSLDSTVVSGVVPLIISVTPAAGRAGDLITINGLGFSVDPPANIVTIGGSATTAASYALLDPPVNGAAEAITCTVPAGAAVGADGLFVTVFQLTSNANIPFTVQP